MLDLDPPSPPAGSAHDVGRRTARRGGTRGLRIGLLNLMPDAALIQAEQQFRRLVGQGVDVRLFAVRDGTRGPAAEAYLDEHYSPHHALAAAGLDGLIITGSEPKQPRLEDEPFFPPLSAVVDWAAAHRVSTVFSCLAAHAAVLHLDGIRRRPLPAKWSGVFDCTATDAHPLLRGMPDTVGVPHSRWNDLAEDDLVAHGYRVLRRSPEVGVDLFVRDDRSLFVFLQGHPEYLPETLAREFRRDVARFLDRTTERFPTMPANYFAADAVERFDAMAARARAGETADQLPPFPDPVTLPIRPVAWRPPATQLFRNWLGIVAERRSVERERGVA